MTAALRGHAILAWAALLVALVAAGGIARAQSASREQNHPPISLLPENPRYFLFRGRPTILITSGEHYGAVVNPDFDYVPYLDELARHGFNHTRLFSGSYIESEVFIEGLGYDNTLAPRPGRALLPWARSERGGATEGGNRFDLMRWDPAYFERLRDFVEEAGRRNIVVEVVLFSAHYHGANWLRSPLHPGNNVNRTPDIPLWQIYRDEGRPLLAHQTELARKLVHELQGYDNVYFELLNEPHYVCLPVADACAPDEWEAIVLAALADELARVGSPQLIAENLPLGPVPAVDRRVSIVNLHYASPEDVEANLRLRRPLIYDETGQQGASAHPYRIDAWRFMLAGGSGVSHLDWSFGPDNEQGTIPAERFRYGGGGPAIRSQLAILKRFFARFDLRRLRPSGVVKGLEPDSLRAWALADGRTYGIFVENGPRAALRLALPRGAYEAEWLSTKKGVVIRRTRFDHAGGEVVVRSPRYDRDVALAVRRRGSS